MTYGVILIAYLDRVMWEMLSEGTSQKLLLLAVVSWICSHYRVRFYLKKIDNARNHKKQKDGERNYVLFNNCTAVTLV